MKCSWRSLTSLLILLAFAVPVTAQSIVLQADRMLDVESGRIVEDIVIVVEGDSIRSINPENIPEGARKIDLGDVTLLPGLIDMHTHLTGDLKPGWKHRPVKERAAYAALRGAHNASITLMSGFTTVRDLGAPGFADVDLGAAIKEGLVEGPRIVPAGHALGATGGHCDATGYAPGILELGPEAGIADGTEAVLRAVRYQIKHGSKIIKVCATAGVLSDEGSVGAQQYTEEELRVIVEEAARHGLKVAAHAHGPEGILAAVRAGVASIDHGHALIDKPDLTEEIIALIIEKETYLVPTIQLTYDVPLDQLPPNQQAKARRLIPQAQKSTRLAIERGVKIAFGTDATVLPHGDNAKEFATLVDLGMSPLEAIRSATLYATDLLGVEDRGRIKEGLLADLIAVPGNPLEDIDGLQQVLFVMKGGKVYTEPASPVTYGHDFQLTPTSVVSFASVAEGKAVLSQQDTFVNTMSQFDRSARMKTHKPVTEEAFLTFAGRQVRAWQKAEVDTITRIWETIRPLLANLNLPLPEQILMIKTNGREEAMRNYTRQHAIILPQKTIDASEKYIREILIHELFHVLSRHDAALRDQLYQILGYHTSNEIEGLDALLATYTINKQTISRLKFENLPPEVLEKLVRLQKKEVTFTGIQSFLAFLTATFQDAKTVSLISEYAHMKSAKLTNPDAPIINHYITVSYRGQPVQVVPLLFSGKPHDDIAWENADDTMFKHFHFKLLVVEENQGQWRPKYLSNNEPVILDVSQVSGFFEQVGENTEYIIHPEETLAENFVLLVLNETNVKTPRIIDQMRLLLTREL